MAEIDDALDDNERLIKELRANLSGHIGAGLRCVEAAVEDIRALKQNSVYDIEFSEGNGYIEKAVREAGLYLAAAAAMTDAFIR